MEDILKEYGLVWDKRENGMRELVDGSYKESSNNRVENFRIQQSRTFYEKIGIAEDFDEIPLELLEYMYLDVFPYSEQRVQPKIIKKYYMSARQKLIELDIEHKFYDEIRVNFKLKEMFKEDEAVMLKIKKGEEKIIYFIEKINGRKELLNLTEMLEKELRRFFISPQPRGFSRE